MDIDDGNQNEDEDEVQLPFPDEEMQLPFPDHEGQHADPDEPIQNPFPGQEIQLPLPDQQEQDANQNEEIEIPIHNEEVQLDVPDEGIGVDFENVENRVPANHPTFSLIIEGNGLDRLLITEPNGNTLAWEEFLLIVAKTLRYKECYQSMLWSFQNINRLFPNANLPTNMEQFWRVVNRREENYTQSVVCSICWRNLGEGKEPSIDCYCQPVQCGPGRANVHLGTVFYISLRSQVESLLSKPGIANDLLYPQRRHRRGDGAMKDVYDGAQYRSHSTHEGQFLHETRHNYSFVMWADGVSPVKSAKVHIVPVFFQILELSPRARQRYSLLAALYVGPRKPSMPHFLTPITVELQSLYLDGVVWQPYPNGELRRSRFMLLIVSADSEERYAIYGMTRHNGHYGCTCCLVDGVENEEAENHTRIYPMHLEGDDRTDADIRHHSELADETEEPHFGVRCISSLYPLDVDLRSSQLLDPLHLYWKGNYFRLLNNCIASNMPNHIRPGDLQTISNRIIKIRTPSKLSRLPRDLTEFSNFTGTELRNNAWFYWLPCAHEFLNAGQLRLSSLFAEFTFILHKDSILPAELDRAEQIIIEYRQLYQDTFPANQLVYNYHLLAHSVRCVRDLGPCFVASGLWFESLNRQVVNYLTSPTDRASQVACRMLLRQMIEGYLDQDLTPETLHELRALIGKETWAEKPAEATGVFTQLRDLGKVSQLNQDQFTALEEANFNNIQPGMAIRTYSKIVIDGVVYQIDNGTTKYNNGIAHVNIPHAEGIYFIEIDSIVTWQDGNLQRKGLFGTPFRTIELAFETTYMHEVDKLDDYLIFVPSTDVIVPGVLVEVNNRTYISRLANRWDND